ncbi:MAG: hypothetical protein GWN99_16950 [Gemmatimonadetes bacterium]|uniref:CheW-like domain-containing protein n=1 Tax=Candidatus Kutchimonas denitrificans TaxID=3056748 RepID=A0AAE5C8J4_9BACT|nr:hypothetical protein [Gemmatimonadota bacterium]NIR74536.1 hypothetical protein [Candidatus Kutchimonas denitrificans]NIS02726.1 hypothetical protein [Gemmatimonadota bacterium]NIT68887.1 hypothetical protein [Gemmatimonadota bacterium]NIU52192.1 hypothetical protein [Gemmatimonadota bacterium]
MKELLRFRVGASRYALPAELIAEIVEIGAISQRLPASEGEGPCLTRVRGRWVPVLDLADVLPDAEPVSPDEDSLLLLLGKGPGRLGLRVERLDEVAVEARRLTASGGDSDLVELDGQLVRLLDVSTLLPAHADVLDAEEDRMMKMSDNRTASERTQFVAFRLCEDEFGVDVMKTFEVLKPADVRKVPKTPDFIEGMISFRDSVVPIIDMRKRLSLPERSDGETARLLVAAIGDSKVGLLVDDVPDVVELPSDSISPAPGLFRGLESRYLDGIARDGDRLMILLNLEEVLTSKERIALEKAIDEATAQTGKASEPTAGGDGEEDAKASRSSKKVRKKKKKSEEKDKKKTRRGAKKATDK